MTFREFRLVARWRIRNEWLRWRHRGALRDWNPDRPAAYAESLLDHCRTRGQSCPWCGRGATIHYLESR
jgi:hypothetical protein